jgi:hypothetical protein
MASLAAALCVSVPALAVDFELGQGDLDRLSVAAREHYDQAVSDYDHAYDDGGLRNLFQAAELAPDVVNLQFIAARMALDKAEKARGAEALDAIEGARAAYQRVLDNPGATEAETARAEGGLDELTSIMAELSERERRLREAGDTFIREYSALQTRLEAARASRPRGGRGSYGRRSDGTSVQGNPLLPTAEAQRRRNEIDTNVGTHVQGLLPDAQASRRQNTPITNP